MSFAQVKIGLPAGSPQVSSILDLSNTGDGTRAFTLPRVASTASIVTPVNGMLIYDISSNCTKVFDNGAWSACLSSTPSGAAVSCAASAINGNYNQGTALTAANTVTIIVNNNGSTALTITPATTDVTLSGASAGMTVASVSPASVSPGIGGGASTITYTLTGTPTAGGAFTATFTKLGLTCVKTGNICLTMVPIVVTSTTTPATLPIPTGAGNTIDFVAAGGTPNSSMTWAMSSNPATGVFSSPATGTGATAQAILIAGGSGIVTVTFTAVNTCGVTLTGTQAVPVSDLAVNSTASAINNFYSQNTALTASNTVTIALVNNSNVNKTVTPLTADLVLSGAGAAGMSVSSFSPASVPVAANGGTATITYALSGTPTTVGAFTATWTKLGLSTAKTSTVCLAIAPIVVSNTSTPFPLPKPTVAGNTINFSATGGTPNSTGMSWTITSIPATGVFSSPASGAGNTAQAVLVDGALGYITATFTVTNTCGLVVTGASTAAIEDNLRKALVAGGCASCAAYDAAATNAYVRITAAEYDKFATVVSGTTNYGMKLADRGLPVGTDGYIANMHTNNIPTTAIPFAFSTKLVATPSCVKLITQSSNTLTGASEVSWGSATGINMAPTAAGTFYFVIKSPNLLMPANTSIAVHGYNNGFGSSAGGTGLDGTTSSSVSTGGPAGEADCTLLTTPATVLATAGTTSATWFFNYDIKWTSTKQW